MPIHKYKMTISRLTVDKLGAKLYDRVSAVIAEIVSNSYDGDAENVTIETPMGVYLATKKEGKVTSKNYVIKVIDDGVGMTPDEVQKQYLVVGKDRRDTGQGGLGDVSNIFHRKVMGRKGIGKLAPFGVCRYIEVISSGGEKISRVDDDGKTIEGYLTAHLTLDKAMILSDTDEPYNPEIGEHDNTLRSETGTTIILREFEYRKVSEINTFNQQLAQRFGISSADWTVKLHDSTKTPGDENYESVIGDLDITVMANSKIEFVGPTNGDGLAQKDESNYFTKGPDGNVCSGIDAGFFYDDAFYPITGWVAYSRNPYKDDLMAGIRIYCRKKIASQTAVFNLKAGFTGEHSIRSYLVGELDAEWLDEVEDLIHTDRRDILWSHELVQAFQEWGQKVVKEVGQITRDPMRIKTWDLFQKIGRLDQRIIETYPRDDQENIRIIAKKIAERLGKSIRPGEVEDYEMVKPLVDLSLMLAPHLSLENLLREASDEDGTPLIVIGNILKTARVAELSSFGRIAEKRIDVINRLKNFKDDSDTDEADLQDLIEGAPWLVNPQWTTITANQSLRTLKNELPKYFKEKLKIKISLGKIGQESKRPDFILSSHSGVLQVIEIKAPKHVFVNEEMERLYNYYEGIESFLGDPLHIQLRKEFKDFHITLVCDEIKLSGTSKGSYEKCVNEGRLTHYNWLDFLIRTEIYHKEFLEEAERQKLIVPYESEV